MPNNATTIRALTRSVSRRKTIEQTLHAELREKKAELDRIEAEQSVVFAGKQRIESTIQAQTSALIDITTGSKPFSIDIFESHRRHLELLSDQMRHFDDQCKKIESSLIIANNDVATTNRSIALNRGRIDACEVRLDALQRKEDRAKLDAEDEENEDNALARRGRR
jgi:Bacterial type III secretion protein (HrpB7)